LHKIATYGGDFMQMVRGNSDFSLRRRRAQTSRFVRSSRSVPEARNTQDSLGNLHNFDADGVEVMQR
jgi:hypothetical protein